MNRPLISIVSPVYGCASCLVDLRERLVKSLSPLTDNFEIILVNDGSKDGAWPVIEALCAKDSRVRGIDLSRNFGQHIAITAGLAQSRGKWVVVMDCDLQDQPEEIPGLYRIAVEQDHDMVLARRANRQDKFWRRWASDAFYTLLGYLTDTPQDSAIANFGIYSRQVIDAVLSIRESHHYFPVVVRSIGFRTGLADVEHAPRTIGKSSYNLRRMMKLALDSMITYSDKPLRLTVRLGAIILGLTLLAGITAVALDIAGKISVPGWTSIIFALCLMSGLIIMLLGIVGLYVGKTFIEAKKRPAYFVRTVCERE